MGSIMVLFWWGEVSWEVGILMIFYCFYTPDLSRSGPTCAGLGQSGPFELAWAGLGQPGPAQTDSSQTWQTSADIGHVVLIVVHPRRLGTFAMSVI